MTKWWHDRVIYQIYPRSFYDTNGDGIGDIQGIIAKLDYLKELGVGAIWLSPVYHSPNRDYGYDVADYCAINPEYGTMADMKQLLREAETKDIKIVMDLIINHTSDEHAWFKASRNPKSAYRDFYIWQKPRVNKRGKELPPNNWSSFFTGPAWTKDEQSGEYYLHLFTKNQPDLNFKNPIVIAEIKKIMRFWLDLGVAGFRCDVINLIYKNSLSDGKPKLLGTGSEHYLSTEGCHKILEEFYRDVWEPYDAFIVGEAHMDHDLNSLNKYLGGDELTTAFVFEHMVFKLGYKANRVKQIVQKWQIGINWNTVFFENHDGMRSVSRFGNDKEWHFQSATMLATLLFTLRGTPFIYQGQEIGMTNAPFKNISQTKDIVSRSVYKQLRRFFIPDKLAFKVVRYVCRDHARTPMQWNNLAKAGFSSGRPWLMVNPNYKQINVQQNMEDSKSIWNYYQQLIANRSQTAALKQGRINFIESPSGVMAFDRNNDSGCYRIIANLVGKNKKISIDLSGEVIASNYSRHDAREISKLQPFEAVIVKIN